jgi:hypothetical protein
MGIRPADMIMAVAIGINGFNFAIHNTGNTSIILTEVTSSNPAFVPSYTNGTTLPQEQALLYQ